MTKRQIYKKFTNLSQEKLNAINNKKTYVKKDVRTTVGDGFRNKLMIPDSEIPKCAEFEVKSKIGNIFKNHNILEEYSVRIYKIDPDFSERYEKKIQVDNNGCKCILFRIDIYFSECSLAVQIDEKGLTDRDLIFEEKRQKALEKKIDCKFLRTNTREF